MQERFQKIPANAPRRTFCAIRQTKGARRTPGPNAPGSRGAQGLAKRDGARFLLASRASRPVNSTPSHPPPFHRADACPRPPSLRKRPMSQPTTDRNLLFAVLSLHMDFIRRADLIAALHAWILDKPTPLVTV